MFSFAAPAESCLILSRGKLVPDSIMHSLIFLLSYQRKDSAPQVRLLGYTLSEEVSSSHGIWVWTSNVQYSEKGHLHYTDLGMCLVSEVLGCKPLPCAIRPAAWSSLLLFRQLGEPQPTAGWCWRCPGKQAVLGLVRRSHLQHTAEVAGLLKSLITIPSAQCPRTRCSSVLRM